MLSSSWLSILIFVIQCWRNSGSTKSQMKHKHSNRKIESMQQQQQQQTKGECLFKSGFLLNHTLFTHKKNQAAASWVRWTKLGIFDEQNARVLCPFFHPDFLFHSPFDHYHFFVLIRVFFVHTDDRLVFFVLLPSLLCSLIRWFVGSFFFTRPLVHRNPSYIVDRSKVDGQMKIFIFDMLRCLYWTQPKRNIKIDKWG